MFGFKIDQMIKIWSSKINYLRLGLMTFIALILVACAGAGGVITNDTESASKLSATMMADFPLPKDARVLSDKSLILGEGESWVGRLELYSPLSPSDTVAFFVERYQQAGWTLISSTKSKNSIIVFTNPKKSITVEVGEGSALSMASKITLTVSPLNTTPPVIKKK